MDFYPNKISWDRSESNASIDPNRPPPLCLRAPLASPLPPGLATWQRSAPYESYPSWSTPTCIDDRYIKLQLNKYIYIHVCIIYSYINDLYHFVYDIGKINILFIYSLNVSFGASGIFSKYFPLCPSVSVITSVQTCNLLSFHRAICFNMDIISARFSSGCCSYKGGLVSISNRFWLPLSPRQTSTGNDESTAAKMQSGRLALYILGSWLLSRTSKL